MNNKKVWIEGEQLAKQYLLKNNYKILKTNAKLANIEVDIVAVCPKKVLLKELQTEYKTGKIIKSSYLAEKKNTFDTLVFVEVKARTSNEFGLPVEAVNSNKQQRIRRFAESFIKQEKYADMPVRFDIISVLNDKIEHLKNAF